MVVDSTNKHPGLVDRLVEHVFNAIMEGRLKHGSELTEDQIAVDFGVSRTPVREAVRRLAEMGVLVVRPRCGIEVASFNANDLEQISILRAELECLALRLAMVRITDDEIKSLSQAGEECSSKTRTRDRVEIFRADSRFHLRIAELSGNAHLLDSLRRLDVKVQLCRMVFCASMTKIKTSILGHDLLLDAIRKRQVSKAEKLLRQHILQSIAVFQTSSVNS